MGTQDNETKQGSYTFNKSRDIAVAIRGSIPTIDPPSTYDDGGPKIGLKRWKKVGYKFNPLVDEVEQPQVMLVNRRLQKICEIVNISNFRLTLKELNQANEISFTVYKKLNEFEQPFYDRIADLMVVYVNGEFFEIGITNKEDASIQKNVVGVSLGYAELSQIITSVQINTDEDLERPDLLKITSNTSGKNGKYTNNTIFYNPALPGESDEQMQWRRLTSMLDRVLSDAPHYKIGTVDPTLRNMQRTFSWEDTDIVSILNDIGQEIGCVFDIVVTYDTDGNAVRKVNAYDLCYCQYCWNKVVGLNQERETSGDTYRNIQNGVCMNCKDTIDTRDGHKRTGGEDISDIGKMTGIFLSTENLTDDITVDGNKDGIKTSFRIVGGDDYMTDTVQGLNPSSSGKITLVPPYIMKNFSKDMYQQYEKYRKVNAVAEDAYQELLSIIYELNDIQLYLKNGKMPVFDEPIVDADTAFYNIAVKISNNFSNTYYIDKRDSYAPSSSNTGNSYAVQSAVSKLMKVFMPKGFSVKVQADSVDLTGNRFIGSVSVYSTSDSEDIITVSRTSTGTIKITSGKDNRVYAGQYSDYIRTFIDRMMFKFGDTNNMDYAGYISQYCSTLLSQNEIEFENDKEKPWAQYSYERLKNWYDGYQACIDAMYTMYQSADTTFNQNTIRDIITRYTGIQECIRVQMDILKNQLYSIGKFFGITDDMNGFDSLFLDSENKLLEFVYIIDNGWMGIKFANDSTAINSLVDMASQTMTSGSASYNMSCDIGTYPFKCKECGSTVVRRLVTGECHCINCGNHDLGEFITYRSMAQKVVDFYNRFDTFISNLGTEMGTAAGDIANMKNRLLANGKSLYGLRKSIQDILNIHNYLDDNQYCELMSYMREQVYSNSNYISEGLTNEEVMQQAKELQAKAKRELSKACMPQYSITATVGSIVALEPYEYLGETYNEDLANFAINNYIHVRFDDEIYKLRVSSIELTYPMSDKISVSFTNAERYENGYSSDVASILANAQSMATSFDAIANQSEKGVVANNLFDKIKQEGLNTSLMAVNGGRNQDVVIDDHGILLRELNEYTNEYDPHQTKMINNNIVMTDDNWKTAKLAIGLTVNPDWTEAKIVGDAARKANNKPTASELEKSNLKYLYGIYADAIVSDLIMTEHFRRIGNGAGDDCTVDINRDGIWISEGALDITGNDARVIINPKGMTSINGKETDPNFILSASNSKGEIFHITHDGHAKFAGRIESNEGWIANWIIENDCIRTTNGYYGMMGMYFGSQGLSLGNKFKVSPDGDVYATSGTFTGTINANQGSRIGGLTIDANGNLETTGDGYFKGRIEATSGTIGGFTITSTTLSGNGIVLDRNAGIKCGNYTTINQNGFIQTSRLGVYGWSGLSSNGAQGIYFDVTKGTYTSAPGENTSSFTPLQLKLGGINTSGVEVPNAYIGIWQQGRMIVGKNDHCNSENHYAYKGSIDGSLYVKKYIDMNIWSDGESKTQRYRIYINKNGELKTRKLTMKYTDDQDSSYGRMQ